MVVPEQSADDKDRVEQFLSPIVHDRLPFVKIFWNHWLGIELVEIGLLWSRSNSPHVSAFWIGPFWKSGLVFGSEMSQIVHFLLVSEGLWLLNASWHPSHLISQFRVRVLYLLGHRLCKIALHKVQESIIVVYRDPWISHYQAARFVKALRKAFAEIGVPLAVPDSSCQIKDLNIHPAQMKWSSAFDWRVLAERCHAVFEKSLLLTTVLPRQNYQFFKIFVADSRSKRDGRHLECLGHYDPAPGVKKRLTDLHRFRRKCLFS